MLDVEPESDEDEDTIIERRRQLRQAIVNKYHQPGPTTPQASSPAAPPSEVDSETAIEERIEEAGRGGSGGSGGVHLGSRQEEEVKVQEELKKKMTSQSALCDAIRNGTCSVRKTSSQRW